MELPYYLSLGGKAIKPVSYNGALHWIGSSCVSLRERRKLSIAVSMVVISFDIENDTFKEVPLTLELQESLSYDHRTLLGVDQEYMSTDVFLGIFGGCLSVVVQGGELYSARNNNGAVSIWVMKDYGVKDSWSKMFSVSTQSMGRPVKYSLMTVMDFRNDMILFLKYKSSLVQYDPNYETGTVVNTEGLSLKGWDYVDTHVENLVSLHTGIHLGSKRAIDGAS